MSGANPGATLVCAADGTILQYNKRAVEIWGRAPEPGQKHRDFVSGVSFFSTAVAFRVFVAIGWSYAFLRPARAGRFRAARGVRRGLCLPVFFFSAGTPLFSP